MAVEKPNRVTESPGTSGQGGAGGYPKGLNGREVTERRS